METDDQETVILRHVAPTDTVLKDRYLLVRQLGEGGFGSVHLAHDRAMHDRPVVVKIQHHQSTNDPWFQKKFSDEVRALSLIDHPGVVSAIDSGHTPDGKPFLVMQYVDGVTLRAVMTPEGMPLPRAAEILKQMGHALAAAHEKGIWHRDLKPENLMLQSMPGGGERVRLIDFGIATVADLANNTATTRVAGSVAYMAPEQRMGQPSASADIYAMGLIAYEMLTGRKPFPSESAGQLTAMQRAGVRVKPSDLRPAVATGAERLVLRSLAWEPKDRPADAREFGDQLHRSIVESDVTRFTGAEPQKKRLHWGLWATFVIAALATAGLAAYYRSPATAKPVPVSTSLPASVPAQDQAVELAFWNSVKDSTDLEMFNAYLAKYPQGQFASLAQAKLALLAKPVSALPEPVVDEKDAWNEARWSNDAQSYQQYLTRFPHGKHEQEARKKVAEFKKKDLKEGEKFLRGAGVLSELNYWQSIEGKNDASVLQDYLKKYPNGLFAPLARKKLEGVVNPPTVPKAP